MRACTSRLCRHVCASAVKQAGLLPLPCCPAEVVGRSAGSRTPCLPHNPAKTWAGSLACWAGGAAAALPLLLHFRSRGMFDAAMAAGGPAAAAALTGWRLAVGVALCCGAGAAVESLPLGDADNFAVPAAAALAAHLYFGS